MSSLVSASQVVTGQVQSLDSVRAHALPSDAMIFASGTKVQPANQNPGSYNLVESANALTLTTTGSVPVVTQSPFADLYKEGSIYFNGTTGNYVSATATGLAGTQWNTTGMTFECWVNYPTFTGASQSAGTTPTAQQIPGLFGIIQAPTGGGINWSFGANTTGYVTLFYGGSGNQTVMAQTPISANTWNHIAVSVAPAGFIYIFINGVQSQVVANRNGTLQSAAYYETVQGTPATTNYPIVIGQYASTAVNAYVADLRITTGAGLYTGSTSSYATFTVPSAPLSPASSGVAQALIRAGQNSPYIANGALTFDRGLKQYMNFGPQTFNIVTQGFTAIWRGALTGTVGNYDRIFSFGVLSGNGTIEVIRIGTSQNFLLSVSPSNASSGGGSVTLSTAFVQGTVYTLVFRYNPVTQIMDAWTNGVPTGSATVAPATLVADRILTPTAISGYTSGGIIYGNASQTMNTLAIYNRALSNAEILNAYSALNTVSQNKAIEIGDVNGTPALSIAGDGRVNVTNLGQTSNVLPWPPAAMTGYVTSLNGGIYRASASGDPSAAWYAFDKSTSTYWQSSGNYSTSSPYPYTGTVTTTDVNGTVYPGDWLQIQLPSQLTVSSYSMAINPAVNPFGYGGPVNFVILGSRDGVNWTLVNRQYGVSWASLTTQTFTLPTPATQAFNYFRIAPQNIYTNASTALVSDVTLYGTADTAQTLTVAQPMTLSYGAQTASLTGISGDKYVPQDFSSSGLNIPAYITTSNAISASNVIVPSSFGPFTGQGSLYYPGGSAPPTLKMPYTTAPSLNFNPFTGDFTAEAWVYNTVATTYNTIVGNYPEDWAFKIVSDRTVQFYDYNTGAALGFNLTGGTVPLNTWTHVAVTYSSSGTTARIFVNGTLATSTGTYTGTPRFTSTQLEVGSFNNGSHLFNGYIGEVRIVRGAALYTTTFTPPTAPLQPIQGVTQAGLPYGTVLLLRNAPAPGRVLTSKFGGANSGSVLSFPPAAMTGYSTLLNSGYGQGTYVASASSENPAGSGFFSYRAFDKGVSTVPYSSNGSLYSAAGAYTGAVRTVDVVGNSYSGEWLQIQMASSIVLTSYSLQQRQDGYGNGNGEPTSWTILGSNDGTNWSVVDQRTFTAWAGSAAFFTFAVASQRAFSFYRLVGSTLGSGAGTNNLTFAEWILNGTIEGPNVTADGRLGVGVSNPVQALEVAGSAVVAGTLSAGNPLMFRNRIINGDLRIAQRGTSLTGQGSGSPYLLDRWKIEAAITTGQYAYYQNVLSVSDTPYQQGFRYASNIVITTALSSYYSCTPNQNIENQNVSDFMWGTPYGVPVTVSLWIKTSATAGSVIPVSIRWSPNAGVNYYVYPFNSVGAGPGIWQYISFTVPPPPTTSGAAPSDANSGFFLYLGNGYQGTPAVAGTWTGTSQFGSSTQTNMYNSINSYFTWTGVQLEKGTVATPFEFRPYATELALCQRYYEQSYSIGTVPGTATTYAGQGNFYGSSDSNSNFVFTQRYMVPKRAGVVPTFYNAASGASGTWAWARSGSSSSTTVSTDRYNEFGFNSYVNVGAAWVVCSASGQWVANAEL